MGWVVPIPFFNKTPPSKWGHLIFGFPSPSDNFKTPKACNARLQEVTSGRSGGGMGSCHRPNVGGYNWSFSSSQVTINHLITPWLVNKFPLKHWVGWLWDFPFQMACFRTNKTTEFLALKVFRKMKNSFLGQKRPSFPTPLRLTFFDVRNPV